MFTKEFIEKQRDIIKNVSPLPWHACSCGKCGMISGEHDHIATAIRGDWGDDYPDIRRIGGSIEGKFETFMNQITYGHIPEETGNVNAQYIEQACNNYPEALDEIERLRGALKDIYLLPFGQNVRYADQIITSIQKKAEKALNEVTK